MFFVGLLPVGDGLADFFQAGSVFLQARINPREPIGVLLASDGTSVVTGSQPLEKHIPLLRGSGGLLQFLRSHFEAGAEHAEATQCAGERRRVVLDRDLPYIDFHMIAVRAGNLLLGGSED